MIRPLAGLPVGLKILHLGPSYQQTIVKNDLFVLAFVKLIA